MFKHGIVPDIIPTEPAATIKICYSEKRNVEFGTEFKPGTIIEPPVEVFWPNQCCSLYTLSMIDPDSKPVETNHWLIINIPGDHFERGDVVAPYTGPKPPLGSGIHRFIFLVYKQEGKIPKLPLVDTQATRHASTLRQFVSEHNLGNPLAGNFLTAQVDDYSMAFWESQK